MADKVSRNQLFDLKAEGIRQEIVESKALT